MTALEMAVAHLKGIEVEESIPVELELVKNKLAG